MEPPTNRSNQILDDRFILPVPFFRVNTQWFEAIVHGKCVETSLNSLRGHGQSLGVLGTLHLFFAGLQIPLIQYIQLLPKKRKDQFLPVEALPSGLSNYLSHGNVPNHDTHDPVFLCPSYYETWSVHQVALQIFPEHLETYHLHARTKHIYIYNYIHIYIIIYI